MSLFLVVCLALLSGTLVCGQPTERPDFSSADETEVILGASDRIIIPEGGDWRILSAPDGVRFWPRAFFRLGDVVYAGTDGSGLWVRRGAGDIRFYRRVDGLAGDVVTHVVEEFGLVFIATDGGVSIWNGQVFVSYTPHNSALPGPFVVDLEPDGRDGVYVALRGGGGAHIRNDRSVVPWPDEGAPPGTVTCMARFPGGGVAVGATGGVYILPDDGEWSFFSLPSTPVDVLEIPGHEPDHADAVGLLAGGDDGLWFIRGPGWEPQRMSQVRDVRSLGRVAGEIWGSFDDGIRVLGREEDFIPAGVPPAPVTRGMRQVVTIGDIVYGASSSGVYRHDGRLWIREWPARDEPDRDVDAIAGDRVGRVVAASEGRLWVRTVAGVWMDVVGVSVPVGIRSMTLSSDGGNLVIIDEGGRVSDHRLPDGVLP